jgi:hypothetical protein
MEYIPYDIRLDDITFSVCFSKRHQAYKAEYQKVVLLFLSMQGKYLLEEDLLAKYPGWTLNCILAENNNIIDLGYHEVAFGNEPILLQTYYDIYTPLSINTSDSFYSLFFAYKVGHSDIMDVDSLLEYHLKKTFNDDLLKFSRFLQLLNRKYINKIISQETALTITEWVTMKEKQPSVTVSDISPGNIVIRKKGVITRVQNDSVTSLSQEQTVLLFTYLQQLGVFLKDEYLTDADAGKAFDILTGYSHNTIRQKLARYTEFATQQNLQALKGVIVQITGMIADTIKGFQPDSQRRLTS